MAAPTPPQEATAKPIHSLVLDRGPLIKDDPLQPITLGARAEQLYLHPPLRYARNSRTLPPAPASKTTLLPFVTVRAPNPASVKFISTLCPAHR